MKNRMSRFPMLRIHSDSVETCLRPQHPFTTSVLHFSFIRKSDAEGVFIDYFFILQNYLSYLGRISNHKHLNCICHLNTTRLFVLISKAIILNQLSCATCFSVRKYTRVLIPQRHRKHILILYCVCSKPHHIQNVSQSSYIYNIRLLWFDLIDTSIWFAAMKREFPDTLQFLQYQLKYMTNIVIII